MPLHKRKPFPLADPPKGLDPNQLVFQVRFTKEVFRDYQEYLNRLNLYRQRVWTCKVTGKTNLTYEEALVSEHRATERVQQFPDELMPRVLNMIQYSTLNLTDLINEIHTNLQKNLYEGIELHAKKGDSVCACKIMEIINDGEITHYKVGWIDKERQVTDMSVVCAEDLVRKRPPISRSILKAFIRESTTQTSPWVVHEKLAKKHGVLTELPIIFTDKLVGQNGFLDSKGSRKNKLDNQYFRHNQKKRKTENGHESELSERRIEELIKYPIDDLLVKPCADDPVFTDRPLQSTDFRVPIDCVGDLLMVWNFCTSFGRLLHLWPFSFEDFENAICHKDSETMLILESHSAILKLLIKDGEDYFKAIQNKKQKLKVKMTNWAQYLCHFLEMRNKPELLDHIATIKRGHYGLLNIFVKLSILLELVAEALTTHAIRDRLDECIEQNQALAARKREEAKTKKEGSLLKKSEPHNEEIDWEHMLVNGKRSYFSSPNGSKPKHHGGHLEATGKVRPVYRKIIKENGRPKKGIQMSQRREIKDEENHDKRSTDEKQKEHLEKEIEKFSVRTNFIGKDRNCSRYWFFHREGRLFVESMDSNQWGYYSTTEELDALIGSLNEKGERERDLKRHLEKYYVKISTALQKRSKYIAQKVLVEEGELRRSTRVQSRPRSSPGMPFLKYVNKWKERAKPSKRQN